MGEYTDFINSSKTVITTSETSTRSDSKATNQQKKTDNKIGGENKYNFLDKCYKEKKASFERITYDRQ